MALSAPDLLSLLRRHLPLRRSCFELSLSSGYPQPLWVDEQGSVRVALLLSIFDEPAGSSLRDCKEQEVCLGEAGAHPPERWAAFFEGQLRAAPAALDGLGDDPSAMPSDLVFAEALADRSLVTADDFARALSDPQRVSSWKKARELEDFRWLLEPSGLGDHVAEVMALLRPSVRLRLEPVDQDKADDEGEADDEGQADEPGEADDAGDEGDAPAEPAIGVGESKVGGEPDLPAGMAWPEAEGRPYTFVAQLDLAALSRFEAARELPSRGLLSFFYDPFPADFRHGNPVRVVHIDDASPLARRPLPEGTDRVPEHRVSFEHETQLPSVQTPFYEALLPADRMLAFYRSLAATQESGGEVLDPLAGLDRALWQLDPQDTERPVHRALGYASYIQGDPYLDVEVESSGEGWEGWDEGSPQALWLRRRSRRWRLLLQIDASGEGDLVLNQDGGFFYFWIPEEALARHDWTQARGSLQCH